MDLTFSSEQEILQDSAVKFAQKACGLDQYKKSLEAEGQCHPDIWKQFAGFGWLSLAVPEAAGGFGGTSLDMALVAEALGAGLVIEPFVAGALLPCSIFSQSAAQKHETLLGKVAEGSEQLAVAYAERAGRFDPGACETTAQAADDKFVITGSKHCVFNAPNASHLIVSARTGDTIGLFLAPRNAPGLSIDAYDVLGGGTAANLLLDKVSVSSDAQVGNLETLERALDRAAVVSCAQVLGGMTALLERTTNYLRTRKQFGVPIGSFQVLQHRVVDMFIEIEQSRSMVMMASSKADSDNTAERMRAVSAAKAHLCKTSKFVAQQAVQLHGGIGMTEELDVGHYFRQLTAFGIRYGDREFHLSRFEAQPEPSA